MNVVLWMGRCDHALSYSEIYLVYHQDARSIQRTELSLFNACSSIDDYPKKWHKGDGRACLLVRPFKLTRIHRYLQSFWAEYVCNLLVPLLVVPLYCSWHVSLTNIMGTSGNSALLFLFLHWNKLVPPLHFSPDREHFTLSFLSMFRLEWDEIVFFNVVTHTQSYANIIYICIQFYSAWEI